MDKQERQCEHGLPPAAWNRTQRTYASSRRIHELFEDQARLHPDAIALEFRDLRLSYGELDERANDWAGRLRGQGVGDDALVGLCMERGVDLIVSLLAVLKAGAAYVPLDPHYPAQRIAFMVDDADLSVVLVDEKARALVPCGQTALAVTDLAATSGPYCVDRPSFPEKGPGLAYTIYTSGSTGNPKGVQIEHRALVNFITSMVERPGIGVSDRWLSVTSMSFDIFGLELFGPLSTGATVVLADHTDVVDGGRLMRLLDERCISVMQATPVTWHMLLAAGWPGRPALKILCGGEALDGPLARALVSRGSSVWNLYGPTETTVWSTLFPVTAEAVAAFEHAYLPIGRPIANTTIHVLSPQGEPVAIGETGELYIGGEGLARGYLRRPALTRERFCANPLDGGRTRLYRTGDLGRWLPSGDLEFLGRADHQVKIRGFRIDLGEIEARLAQHADVAQAVVVVREDRPGDRRLVAYVVGATSDHTPSPEALRRFLADQLPPYMVPAAYVRLDKLPLTPNAKVDRKALPAPKVVTAVQDHVDPRTDLEASLCEAFQDILGLARVGIDEDFFALGGHSLLAMRLCHHIETTLGVRLAPSLVFTCPTVEALANAVERPDCATPAGAGIMPVPRSPGLPVSASQRQLWFLHRLTGPTDLYNEAFALELTGPLDVGALERAWADLVVRHEALRTTFHESDGRPTQTVHAPTPPALSVESVAGEVALADRLAAEARIPFDLETGPLLHLRLLRRSAEQHTLILVIHHLITDSWSQGILLRELAACYRAAVEQREPDLEPLPVQYADFAVWQQDWLAGSEYRQHLAFWKRHLAGCPSRLDLPLDFERSERSCFAGDHVARPLTAAQARAVESLAEAQGKTPFMVILAALELLLHHLTGSDDLVLGTPAANRTHAELENTVGFFVNTLALRTRFTEGMTVQGLLDAVQSTCRDAFAHQETPLASLINELPLERQPGISPLVQVVFQLDDERDHPTELGPLGLTVRTLRTPTAKFDLLVCATRRSNGWQIEAEYATALFERESIVLLLERLGDVLAQLPGHLDTPLDRVPWPQSSLETPTTADEEESYPREETVPALFRAQTARTPEAVAVIWQDRVQTYRRLDERSNRLARLLQERGVQPGARVGLQIDRGPDLIALVLGVLKAGAAYVPLDSAYPRERLRLMAEDAELSLVISDAKDPTSVGSAPILSLDALVGDLEAYPATAPEITTHAEDPAYVMFTSGSTGRPKGVAIGHRGIVRLLFGQDYVDLSGEQTFLQLAPVGFDASTFEIWGALLHGHRLVLYPDRVPDLETLGSVIETQGVSCLWLTASLFNLIIDEQPEILHPVRQVLTGGEALSVPHVRRAQERLPGTQLINGYGPTESTTFTCCHRIGPLGHRRPRSIPIGRPLAHTTVVILDRYLQPVPAGVPGELCIGGDGLALGYVGRPDLTAERFVPNPLDGGASRLYRTGDRCRERHDGTFEFLGRLDDQVKIRGFRIEPGEIEAVLAGHADVREAAVVVRTAPSGLHHLAAYAACPGAASVSSETLRAYLAQRLPEYMIPATLTVLDHLPLTPNGKVDRRALPDVEAPLTERAHVPPRTPTERVLAELFAEVLGLDEVCIHDSFFTLGGNSLLGVRLFYHLGRRFAKKLPLATLFQAQTVAQLAAILDEGGDLPNNTSVVPLVETGRGEALFILPGIGGHSLAFMELARRMKLDRPVYGLELRGLEGEAEPLRRIEDMADYFLDLIRRIQPQGPYHLLGYSLGGRIALEMALRCQAEGEAIGFLGILAATAPGYIRSSPHRLVRIGLRLRDFQRLSPSQKRDYLVFKSHLTAKRLWRRIARCLRSQRQRTEAVMLQHIHRVRDAAMEGFHRYEPRGVFRGDLLLIRDADIDSPLYRALIESKAGWERFVAGTIRTCEVSAGHTEILRPPHVEVVARALRDRLNGTGGREEDHS